MSGASRVRKVFPWVTPALVVVEIALVMTGVLRPAQAVVVFLVIELIIAVFVIGSVVTAVRTYRRSAGVVSRRDAAGAALESVLPRPVARAVVVEVYAWLAFTRWARRRRLGDGEFSYGKQLRPLLLIAAGLLVIEGTVVELVVGMVFGQHWWLWVLTGLHLYALCWIMGITGSLHTMPHDVGPSVITLRDSIFHEHRVSVSEITSVRVATTANTGRSGLLIDSSGDGRLCHGDGTVSLALADNTTIRGERVRRLAISPDRPAEFVAACRVAMLRTPRRGR